MTTTSFCPRCGKPLAASAPKGLCPECLMKAGFPTGGVESDFVQPTLEQLAHDFPDLEILEMIGRGGMGMVYKARQRQLDRLVALKLLSKNERHDPAFAERFTREARALAKLNHPNIVSIYDFGQNAGHFYFVMEYVDGLNLRQLLSASKIAPAEALAIVPQICDALQYAHNQGIVHRDIKPENILLDKSGKVKIADFGLAKIVGQPTPDIGLTMSGEVMGTPHYMAPEQVEHPQEVDHRADIYSLGVVFYQMLTGELPMGHFAPPSKKVQIDVRLDDVVLRALEKEPELRYQQAGEVKTQVETIVGTPGAVAHKMAAIPHHYFGFEYRSKQTLFGLPLLHVATGFDPTTGKQRVAKGIVAIGGIAKGVIALGGLAMGVFAFGGCGLGIVCYSGISIGLIAFGGMTLGLLLAYGGLAISSGGATGGISFGYIAEGGLAFGAHAKHDIWLWNVLNWSNSPSFVITLAAIGLLSTAVIVGLPWWLKWMCTRSTVSIQSTSPHYPRLLVFSLIVLGMMVMLKFMAVFVAGPKVLPGAVLSGLLLLGLAYRQKWAYLVTLAYPVYAILAVAHVNYLGGILVLFLDALVCVPVLLCTDSFFSKNDKHRATWLGCTAAVALLAGILAFILPSNPLLSKSMSGWPKTWNTESSTFVDGLVTGRVTKEFSMNYVLPRDGQFSIDNINGQIQITGGDGNEITVKGVIRGDDRATIDSVKTDVDSDSDHVAIHTRQPSWTHNVRANYTIQVPQHTRLANVSCVNGQIVITGVSRDIKASTVNGTLELNLGTLGGNQAISLNTVNGGIEMAIPSESDAEFSANTVNGSISSDFSSLEVGKGFPVGNNLKGKLGNGSAQVKATTVNGSISFRQGSYRNVESTGNNDKLIKDAPPPVSDRWGKVAQEFVHDLEIGKFEQATTLFDDRMKAALSAEQLHQLWQQLNQGGGKYNGQGKPTFEKLAAYDVVYVPCLWAKSPLDLKIVFDTNGKISGLWVWPPHEVKQ